MGGSLIPNTLEEFPGIQVGIQGIDKNLMMTLSMEAKVSPKDFLCRFICLSVGVVWITGPPGSDPGTVTCFALPSCQSQILSPTWLSSLMISLGWDSFRDCEKAGCQFSQVEIYQLCFRS